MVSLLSIKSNFFVNLQNYFSGMSKLLASNITCGAPKVPHWIHYYSWYILMIGQWQWNVKWNDVDTCLVSRSDNVTDAEKQVNEDFANICWEQSIHFGVDNTKSIFFASKRNIQKIPKLDININVKLNNICELLT